MNAVELRRLLVDLERGDATSPERVCRAVEFALDVARHVPEGWTARSSSTELASFGGEVVRLYERLCGEQRP